MSKQRLSGQFIALVETWMTDFPPQRLSVHLRTMFLEYVALRRKKGIPPHFFEMVNNVQALYLILDAAEIEIENWPEEFEEELPEQKVLESSAVV